MASRARLMLRRPSSLPLMKVWWFLLVPTAAAWMMVIMMRGRRSASKKAREIQKMLFEQSSEWKGKKLAFDSEILCTYVCRLPPALKRKARLVYEYKKSFKSIHLSFFFFAFCPWIENWSREPSSKEKEEVIHSMDAKK